MATDIDRCEVCGGDACFYVQDVSDSALMGDTKRAYVERGSEHKFCEAHTRGPRIYVPGATGWQIAWQGEAT